MTLNTDGLTQAFTSFFTNQNAMPATVEVAGARWASIYGAYASNAQAGDPPVTVPVSGAVDVAADALSTALASAFRTSKGASDFVSAVATAFSTFWPSVAFVGAGATGTAKSPIELTSALETFISDGNPDADPPPTGIEQAGRIASALDAWTKTVLVTNIVGGVTQPPVKLS